ncbi:MAG: family 43 glycosylhydrolase [Oscillospiraceae bacterium]|nr:family 43 glycosylhydrolase [Oscillospiraceae bacterium]
MKQTYCNPLDLAYRYQHMKEGPQICGFREGADPTLVHFKGCYYLFVSMSAGFWHSTDMLNWEFHAAPDLLIYDYAPDVRQMGDYLYFCASRRDENCPILRTADPLTEKFTEVSAPFDFWDPDIFCDDDGRVYLYWGCTNTDPIYGIELDSETMTPIGEKRELIFGRDEELGYERPGDNGVVDREHSVVYQHLRKSFNPITQKIEFPAGAERIGNYTAEAMTKMFLSIGKPYIEGAFMTKYQGRYYLQYACPGTQFNTYADGVYVGNHPLGPFTLQTANPFSSKPGGFITGAGHGSTIADQYGNYWHASTMRISVNYDFERRVGLFPAAFDKDGVLFCNQNFADYPFKIPQGKFDAAALEPEWMLLSYKKPVMVSSTASGSSGSNAVDEDIRTWWSAASAKEGEWLCVDLGKSADIRAIQVNLADENVVVDFPADSYGDTRKTRHIELEPQISHYTVEVSNNGDNWHTLEQVDRECSNGYYEYMDGVTARYVRVSGGALPYGQPLRVSGLRVFGNGDGEKPAPAQATAVRLGDLDARVVWEPIPGAQGCNVRYGIAPDKLYHSWLVYDANEVTLSTLIKGQTYFVRVDSFNENGITPGEVILMKEAAL